MFKAKRRWGSEGIELDLKQFFLGGIKKYFMGMKVLIALEI